MKKRKLRKILLLDWRKFWILIGLGFVSVIAHNAFYALFGFEEPFFFILALLVPFYLLLSFIYTIYRVIEHRIKKNKRKK